MELGVHASRHDATDPDVVVTVVEHHGFAEAVESELGCVVARAAAKGVLPREAGNIDDKAAAAPGEAFQRLVRAVERAIQIEIDIAVPLLRRHLRHLVEDPFAGVVDENIEPAEFPVHGLEEFADLLNPGDIRGMTGDPPQRLHLADRPLDRFAAAPADGDRRSLAQQSLGDGAPDPPRAAGDHGDLARKWFHI